MGTRHRLENVPRRSTFDQPRRSLRAIRRLGQNGVIASGTGQWMVYHTYDMQDLDTQRILQIRPITVTEDGWPNACEPVAAP